MPNPNPNPLRVFLCHAKQDKSVVRELYKALKSEDWIDPWLDTKKILPGQEWELAIEKAVEDSDVFIICLSNLSVQKDGYVQWEVRYAYNLALKKVEGTIFLIPLRLDDCFVPKKLQAFQWVDYFGDETKEAYLDLLQALKVRYQQKLEQEATNSAEALSLEQLATREPERKVGQIKSIGGEPFEKTKIVKKPKAASNEQMIEKKSLPKPLIPVVPAVVGMFLVIALCAFGIVFGKRLISPATPALTEIPIVVATEVLRVTEPVTASSTPSAEKDGMTMIDIPAGDFMLGSLRDGDEEPPQTMYLDVFSIDQTEVTNKMYAMCVADGVCNPPSYLGSPNERVYFGNPKYENYPVIYVNWDMAKAYCQWAGRDLPTEFQWEKAARGIEGLTYPWGEQFDGRLLNYCDSTCPNLNMMDKRYDDGNVNTAPVGSYQNGASVFGVLDMSGNVWEWTNDWYDVYPNGSLTASTYFGSKFHVIRGGSWEHNMYEARSSNRSYFSVASDALNDYTGFRCARSK